MKFLIVVDMQNDFLTGSLKNDAAVAIVDPIVEKIKNFDGCVIATKDTHFDDYLETQEGKFLPVKHCIAETQGWQLNSSIRQTIINKQNRYLCHKATFGSLELPQIIKDALSNKHEETIEEIELCGTCTGICVISNALILKAAFPEVPVIVDSKACACLTPETHHTALEAMKLCQVIIK